MTRPGRLLAVMLALGVGPAAALDGTADVLELFADLPERFVVESVEDGEQGRRFRLRSVEPIQRGSAGPLYLRASVTVSSSPGAEAAAAEVARRLAAADPDVGLSYAWDFVTAGEGSVIHLHAACTFSQQSFLKPVQALVGRVAVAGALAEPPASFWCSCGGGCRAGVPVAITPGETRRLPPVRRPADDAEETDGEEEYDNRLDPSGAWKSDIGELSLMHYADGLSFTYSAVFGPTAHICEGAGVAGLVATDRYEFVDEQGRVAFVIAETGVRMELVDGIASFCGSGWAGDSFAMDGFSSPGVCTVVVEHSHFHVVDHLNPERRFATVGQGSRVEVVPVWLTGDREWVLGRFFGPLSAAVGLLARGHLECPPPAGSGR